MGCPDIGNDRNIGGRDLRKASDLAGMVHSHLQDHDLVFSRQVEDRHGQTNVIIEIPLSRMDPEPAGQDGRDHLPAGRLAYAPGDPHDLHIVFFSVIMSQIPERPSGILHKNIKPVRTYFLRSPGYDAAGSSLFKGGAYIGVTVKAFTRKGKKDTAGNDLTAVRHHREDLRFLPVSFLSLLIAGQQSPSCRLQ